MNGRTFLVNVIKVSDGQARETVQVPVISLNKSQVIHDHAAFDTACEYLRSTGLPQGTYLLRGPVHETFPQIGTTIPMPTCKGVGGTLNEETGEITGSKCVGGYKFNQPADKEGPAHTTWVPATARQDGHCGRCHVVSRKAQQKAKQ